MTAHSVSHDTSRLHDTSIISGVAAFAVLQGLGYPLLAIILERKGTSPVMIGLGAAMTQMALLFASPYVGRAIARIGTRASLILGILLAAGSFFSMAVIENTLWWLPVRFLLGIGIAFAYISGEVWINHLAAQTSRGRLLGFYATCLNLCFMSGLVIIPLAGTDGYAPFIWGAGLTVALGIPLLFFKDTGLAPSETAHVSVGGFLRAAPILVLCVVAYSFFDQAVLSFMPGFAHANGLSTDTTAILMISSAAGSVALQIPIGWIADRKGGRFVMLTCALTTAIGAVFVPFVIANPFVACPIFFFWGGMMGGIYTVALHQLGTRFSGHTLIAGNAAFGMAFGAGGAAGPSLTGVIVEFIGPIGLCVVLAAVFAALFLTIFLFDRPAAKS